jgi:hypothetical protein
MPEQTSGELNFAHELATNADQALLLSVNPDLSCHFMKDFALSGWRPEARIGLKDQFN